MEDRPTVRIWITPKRYPIYEKVIAVWRAVMAEAGVASQLGEQSTDETLAHLIFEPVTFRHLAAGGGLPRRAILLNTEPLSKYTPGSSVYGDAWRDMLAAHHVLDYSGANIAWLEANGTPGLFRRAIGFGYHPVLEDVPVAQPETDVLFVGSITPRRTDIIEEMRARGLRVDVVTRAFGPDLDARLARAKLLVNIHSHRSPRPLEIVRLAHPVANGIPVLSERGKYTEVAPYLEDAMTYAPYLELAATAVRIAGMEEGERRALGARGRAALARRDVAVEYREVLRFLCALPQPAIAAPRRDG